MSYLKRYIFSWKNNSERAKWYGKECRIIAKAAKLTPQKFKRTVVIEFEDGFTMCTSLLALRSKTIFSPPKQLCLWNDS